MEASKLHDIFQVILDSIELLYFIVFQFLDTISVYLNGVKRKSFIYLFTVIYIAHFP